MAKPIAHIAGSHAPSPAQARALRRAAIAGAAFVTTLWAHLLGSDATSLTPAAGVMGALVVALALICGPRGAPSFRPRRARASFLILLAVQASMHLAMTEAPWAFGLAAHHQPAILRPTALVLHLAAAALLCLVLARAERLLAALVGVVRLVRRWITPRRPERPRSIPLPRLGRLRPAMADALPALPARGPPA